MVSRLFYLSVWIKHDHGCEFNTEKKKIFKKKMLVSDDCGIL